MAKSNISAVLKAKDDLCLEDRPIPEPSCNEVLIAIQSVGICGSDVHYWKNGSIGDFIVKEPMVLGHESSGIVVKTGQLVKDLKPGDRVCIEPGVPCRVCEFCKIGRYNLCADIKFCATPPVDGSLCQYYTHAADFCYKLPDDVTLEEGALIEPLSVGVHACRRAGVTAGSSVLICGADVFGENCNRSYLLLNSLEGRDGGEEVLPVPQLMGLWSGQIARDWPIGLVNLLVCKAMGASSICITDISESRLEMAMKLGASHQILVKGKQTEDLVREITSKIGKCPDVTIECSGAESSVKLAILVTKRGGTVVLVGLGAPQITVPIIDATVREVDIRGIFRYANCYPVALDLIASKAVNVKPLITHRFSMDETLKAFETAHTGAGGAIKVLINLEDA